MVVALPASPWPATKQSLRVKSKDAEVSASACRLPNCSRMPRSGMIRVGSLAGFQRAERISAEGAGERPSRVTTEQL
ncbi:hypothetical protein D3C79_1035530 [compost metagenome]